MKKLNVLFVLMLSGTVSLSASDAKELLSFDGSSLVSSPSVGSFSPGESSASSDSSASAKYTAKIDVLMSVVKQDAGQNNCSAFALTNAICFFQKLPFAGAHYQRILDQIKVKVNGPIESDALRSLVSPVSTVEPLVNLNACSSCSTFAILDYQELAFGFDASPDLVVALAENFKKKRTPAGFLLKLVDPKSNYAHWVFIGITQDDKGISVVIPESASKDYVSAHLEFLKEHIISKFE